MSIVLQWPLQLRRRLALPPTDLLHDPTYRRLWSSTLISSFGNQITMLALPLTAAVFLRATPTQTGRLTAMEILPFVLFSLPGGVWLDRVRKLPFGIRGRRARHRGSSIGQVALTGFGRWSRCSNPCPIAS